MQVSISNIKKNYVLREIDDLAILIPLHTSPLNSLILNKSALLFWKLVQNGLKKQEIITSITEYFSNDIAEIEKMYADFLKLFIPQNPQAEKKRPTVSGIKPKPQVKKAVLELTGKCNLNCFHCYAIGKRQKQDMDTALILRLLDEMMATGTLFVNFTGGEVFSRKDFVKIYEHSRKIGLITSLISNATLLNDEILEVLRKYPPTHIKISLYGSSPEVHDAVTRVPGSFNRTIKAVKRLHAAGINVFFGSTLFKETEKDLNNIRKLATDLGIRVMFTTGLMPTLEKDCAIMEHSASEATHKLADKHNYSLAAELVEPKQKPSKRKQGEIFDCNAGLVNYGISSDGHLILCLTDTDHSISLIDKSLQQGLAELKKVRLDRLRIPENCKICPVLYNLYN